MGEGSFETGFKGSMAEREGAHCCLIFLFRIIIKCNSVWGTISGATLQDLNLAYPLPAV